MRHRALSHRQAIVDSFHGITRAEGGAVAALAATVAAKGMAAWSCSKEEMLCAALLSVISLGCPLALRDAGIFDTAIHLVQLYDLVPLNHKST